LPRAEWELEILRRIRFRDSADAFEDARFLLLSNGVGRDRSMHREYLAYVAAEIIFELRVCRDVYRKGLNSTNRGSKLNRHRYVVELAVAPRAAALLRSALDLYFSKTKIPFEVVQMLFDPNYPHGPFRFKGKKVVRSRPAKDWAKLLKSIVSDRSFKGLDQEDSFLVGAPFHMSRVVHGRSSAIYDEKLIPTLMKLYSKERWWIEEISFLWDAVLHEVKRQHREVDLEVYGRNLDDPEKQKLDEVLEIY
jgi:hypothetical protein